MKTSKRNLIIIVAIVLVIAVGACFLGIHFLALPNELENIDTRQIIYADFIDSYLKSYNASIPQKGVYVSSQLKQKIAKYEGKDVLFKVIVQYPYFAEYDDQYKPSEEYIQKLESLEKKIAELENRLEKLKKADTTDMTGEELRLYNADRTSTEASLSISGRELEKLRNEDRSADWRAHVEKIFKRELDYAKSVGAKNVEKFKQHSEINVNALRNPYIMELTATMIEKMTARETCVISLMSKERVGNYDKRITDTLTHRLERMTDNEAIEVAVVSLADDNNLFAYEQGITQNGSYNRLKPYGDWEKFIKQDDAWSKHLFDDSVEKHITDIIERNGIVDKRIMSDNLPKNGLSIKLIEWDAEYFSVYNIAGFNARLTKEQILKLAKDKDVKAIYVVVKNNTGVEYWH